MPINSYLYLFSFTATWRVSLWPYSCSLGQQTTVFSGLTPSTRSTALPGRLCPHQATRSCSPTPKFLIFLCCPRATWGPCEYACTSQKDTKKQEKHRETSKPSGGNCLYLIIMYIHMHPVHVSCNKQHWFFRHPSVLPPILLLWRQLLSRSVFFVCARSPSAVGFPCMSSRARVTGGLWSCGAYNGTMGSVLQARR